MKYFNFLKISKQLFFCKILYYMVLVLLLFSINACRSSKDYIYLKDIATSEIIESEENSNFDDYRIKPGDILYVSIKSLEPEVNMLFNSEEGMNVGTNNTFQKFTTPQGAYLYGFEVNKDGNLVMPILGTVPVAENTQVQVEDIVQQYADKFLKDAVVKVKLLNFRVTVLGEVKDPGIYYNYNNRLTVLDAIAMANGNSDYANISKVTVMRTTDEGKLAMKMDLTEKGSVVAKGFYLQPNDYVFVEPASNKSLQVNSVAYSLIISSVSVMIAVLALVK